MMNWLSHAVIWKGVVYYNTIVSVGQHEAILYPYREECESTSFINGVILILEIEPGNINAIVGELGNIIEDCADIEEVIDAILREVPMEMPYDDARHDYSLISLWPGVRILASGVSMRRGESGDF